MHALQSTVENPISIPMSDFLCLVDFATQHIFYWSHSFLYWKMPGFSHKIIIIWLKPNVYRIIFRVSSAVPVETQGQYVFNDGSISCISFLQHQWWGAFWLHRSQRQRDGGWGHRLSEADPGGGGLHAQQTHRSLWPQGEQMEMFSCLVLHTMSSERCGDSHWICWRWHIHIQVSVFWEIRYWLRERTIPLKMYCSVHTAGEHHAVRQRCWKPKYQAHWFWIGSPVQARRGVQEYVWNPTIHS